MSKDSAILNIKDVILKIIDKVEVLEDKRKQLENIVYEIMAANKSNVLNLESCKLNLQYNRTSAGSYTVLVCSVLDCKTDLSLPMGTGSKLIHGDCGHEWKHPQREDVELFLSLASEIENTAKLLGN